MLIEVALLLLVIGHGLLIYACHDMRSNGASAQTSWAERVEVIHELLEEVVDAIDSFGGTTSSSPPAMAGGGIQEILTSMLMDRVTSAMTHGPPQSEGEIREGEDPPPDEIRDESVDPR